MNRYLFNRISDNKYLTSISTTFPQSLTDKYIIVRDGDRLDTLAKEFYDNENDWWILATANNLGKGNLNIPPGIQLRIPFPIVRLKDKLQSAARGE